MNKKKETKKKEFENKINDILKFFSDNNVKFIIITTTNGIFLSSNVFDKDILECECRRFIGERETYRKLYNEKIINTFYNLNEEENIKEKKSYFG